MKMILSAKDTAYLQTEIPMKPESPSGAALTEVDGQVSYQTLLGFGGAFTDAAAVTFSKMGAENQRRILEAYFDPKKGLGYSLGRVAIGSCDFSESMYDYLDGGDTTLASFDLSYEEQFVFPLIRAARDMRGESLRLMASPWSPPAFMKDNKNRKHGGALLPEYADLYAQYLILYIENAHKCGIAVEWLSVQNETDNAVHWDSCIYSAAAERDFVKNHLGPALEKAGRADIKLLVHDHNRDILLERVLPIYQDAAAARYIWGAAIHWYVSEDFSVSSVLHEAHPDKHLLFTEGCVEGGPAPGVWSNGERYARNIIGDLNNWVEGWIDWNLILDTEGGPNHVGNYCCAPILCDIKADTVIFNPSYHYIAHFARHIQPSAVRVSHTTGNPALNILSVRNPNGAIVLVALNETEESQSLDVSIGGHTASAILPPHSIATVIA